MRICELANCILQEPRLQFARRILHNQPGFGANLDEFNLGYRAIGLIRVGVGDRQREVSTNDLDLRTIATEIGEVRFTQRSDI